MLSSIAIAFKWKAAKALRFAESQAELRQKQQNDGGVDGYNDVDSNSGDDSSRN